MLNFVILREDREFFRFFNSVKNAQFCHFVRGPWIFSLLQFCQKCSILSFCERPLYFFASSILSKMLNFVIFREERAFFHFFNFVKTGPFCHFWKVDFKLWNMHTLCFMIYQNIFVQNPQFCHFKKAHILFSLFQFCQKCSILSFSERPVYLFFTS